MHLLRTLLIHVVLIFLASTSSKAFVSCRTFHRTCSSVDCRAPLHATTETTVWTKQDLESYAEREGLFVSLTTLGPGYRAIVRARHNSSQILGYVEGFVRPTGNLLHLDKMVVFQSLVKRARSVDPDFRGGGTVFGPGLVLGYLCLLHGQEQGCNRAEFLAIDDEYTQHKRLVRFYKNAGFEFVKYVGDDLSSVPDRLVWGGCGTLLRQDISILLEKWTALMKRSQERRE